MPAGNAIRLWTSAFMSSFIIAKRNDIHLLDITYTIVQLRKALNAVFSKVSSRGTFLIYAQAKNALKLNHEAVFTFVTQWVSGLISNYRQVIKTIVITRKRVAILGPFLSRPQVDALSTIRHTPRLSGTSVFKWRRSAFIARVPAISLSMKDSYIWSNECHCLRIPSIQLCDTQSLFEKITYPIITNQRSVSVGYLMIHLFAEACSMALIHEHLFFQSFSKQLNLCRRNTRLYIRGHFYRRWRRYKSQARYWHHHRAPFGLALASDYPRHRRLSPRKASFTYVNYHHFNYAYEQIRKNETLIQKNTRYGLLKHRGLVIYRTQKSIYFFSLLKHVIWRLIKLAQRILVRLTKFKLKRRKPRKQRRLWYRRLKYSFMTLINLIKQFFIDRLSLRKALSRKRREEAEFLTTISFRHREILRLYITALCYNLPKYHAPLMRIVRQISRKTHKKKRS